MLGRPPVVGGPHRECFPGAARAGDAAVTRPRRPVIPCRCDNERVERERSGDGAGRRAVLEGGVGLRHTDDRDPRGVQGVPVTVRVDRALEAGDQLVGAGVDGPAAREVLLPAGDPDREQRRVLRQAGEPARPSGADDEAGELRPVSLELGRLVGIGPRRGEIVVLEDVDAFENRAGQVVVCVLDARVEQRDRHAAAAVTGQPESGPGGRAGRQVVPLEQLAGGGCRVGDADRIDALDLGKALKEGDRARIERSGEAREHAREAELGPELEAGDAETGDELALGGLCCVVPASLVRLAGPPARCGHASRERRRTEDDDHPLPDRHLRARAADEPPPRDRLGACTLGEPPVAAATEIAAAARPTIASRPSWESRLGEGVERKVTRVGDRLDEPCGGGDHRRVVGAELERRLRGVGKGARSSEFAATPPTTAIRSAPVASAASRVRSTRARTIARW